MNNRKKTKTLQLSCLAALFLAAGILAALYWVHANRDKTIINSHVAPTHYTIEKASEKAVTIVYGTLGPKSKIKPYERIVYKDLVELLAHYREAEIQVIQMVKGDPDAQTVPYWELADHYETCDVIYHYEDANPLEPGKNYLFFLNSYGSPLSAVTVMEVDENGILIPPWDMRIENEAQALSEDSLPVSLEDYIAEIQKYLD